MHTPRSSTLLVLLACAWMATGLEAQSTASRPGTESPPLAGPAQEAPPWQDELEAQLRAVRESVEQYRDVAVAEEAGFERLGRAGHPLMGEHWIKRALAAESELDLLRPSTLQYAVIHGERRLMGVAYTLWRKPGDPLPEGFAGPADRWHVHDIEKLFSALGEARPLLARVLRRRAARRAPGSGDRTELTMVHAWLFLENPDGVFAQEHPGLPYLRAGLPAEWARADGLDAAWGVATVSSDACGHEERLLTGLAGADDEQQGTLMEACERVASTVREHLSAEDVDPEGLNGAAAAAWREYVALKERVLTPEQLERLGATMEQHPGH